MKRFILSCLTFSLFSSAALAMAPFNYDENKEAPPSYNPAVYPTAPLPIPPMGMQYQQPPVPPAAVAMVEPIDLSAYLDAADRALEKLEEVQKDIVEITDPLARSEFIRENQGLIQDRARVVMTNLNIIYKTINRKTIDLDRFNPNSLGVDHSVLSFKVEEKGYCKKRNCKLYRCTDENFWAGEAVCAMSGDCDPDSLCCWAYALFGLYSIPVALTGLSLMIAQGFCIAVTSPCRCEWEPTKTKPVAQLDKITPEHLLDFILHMKKITARLRDGH